MRCGGWNKPILGLGIHAFLLTLIVMRVNGQSLNYAVFGVFTAQFRVNRDLRES